MKPAKRPKKTLPRSELRKRGSVRKKRRPLFLRRKRRKSPARSRLKLLRTRETSSTRRSSSLKLSRSTKRLSSSTKTRSPTLTTSPPYT
jgi:hypothetical protein